MTKATSAKVDAAIRKIRDFYELGRQLPRKPRHKDAYKKHVIDDEALRLGVNPDTLRKARTFADPEEGYTRTELNALCRLIREVQPVTREVRPGEERELPVFRPTHVIRLLSVWPKKRRWALQKRCIEAGWSTAELEREIAKRFGTRREGGRRRTIPPDLTGFLAQLENVCEQWRRWWEELSRDPDEVTEKHVLLDDLPDELGLRVRAVSDEIWDLHRLVADELGQAQPGREPRSVLKPRTDDQEKTAARRPRKG